MERNEALRVGGLALLALAGVMAWGKSSKAGATSPGPVPKPTPTPTPAPASGHQPIAQWIHDARAKPRPDVVALIAGRLWVQTMQRYLQEQWPEAIDGTSAGVGAWTEIEGQWLRDHAGGFWTRGDIQAAWFGPPPPAVLVPASGSSPAVFGSTPGKVNVIGQFLKEQGAPDPAYGWAGAAL